LVGSNACCSRERLCLCCVFDPKPFIGFRGVVVLVLKKRGGGVSAGLFTTAPAWQGRLPCYR
jgi:hypothetical protein